MSLQEFVDACQDGDIKMIASLLLDFDPSENNNYAIRVASYNGHVDVVKLLLADHRVDPSALDNQAIRAASQEGHLRVVRLLLEDSRVDPSANNNDAIKRAQTYNHLKIANLLIEHMYRLDGPEYTRGIL
uniref:Uncharacterized protein n=1 Tax=viral metagenome TaxID=1070528 RepID=A0A6C0JWC8_9ZZZZ